jgi:hypothetical protein
MADKIGAKALQKNWKVLHDQLNLDGLVPSLFQDELIDFNLKRDLEESSNRQRKTDKFLNHLLENITEENFETFVHLLRNDNSKRHQELGRRLKETFKNMIQNGGSSESGKNPKDDTEMCEDHSSTVSVIQRTSHRYSLRQRSSGGSSFVDEQSDSSSESDEESEDDFLVPDSQSSTDKDCKIDRNNQDEEQEESDEEPEDDFIVPDSLTSTDYDYRNSQDGEQEEVDSESDEETPEVDTTDSEIDKENYGQGSSKARSVAENEHPLRKRRSSSSVTERQPLQELNGTPPKRRAINSHDNTWICDVEPRPFPYIPQLGDEVLCILDCIAH